MKLSELRGLFGLRPLEAERAIRKRTKQIDPPEETADFRYKIQKDGKDALFKIGQHKHRTVSEVQKADPSYLDWILNQPSYSNELKDIIRFVRYGSFAGPAQEGEHAGIDIIADPMPVDFMPRASGKSTEELRRILRAKLRVKGKKK
jgi:exodeoxyribonuclease X-like protein